MNTYPSGLILAGMQSGAGEAPGRARLRPSRGWRVVCGSGGASPYPSRNLQKPSGGPHQSLTKCRNFVIAQELLG